ncbi:MAG: glycoside hydrolase family 3 C-terminal domain-containing protein, partial [Lachnospiraceae bacterium]|nr:glycoside hydrolase family 3 C-terminal domain-containing protein [Lachnospiraceae bacterium]
MDREKARKRAEELVDQMTVEEMASQLKFNADAIERLGIPEYNWWNEALHGVARAGTATMFPQAIGLAATFDIELFGEIGECIATEGRAKYNEFVKHEDRDIYKGLTYWSPNVNIFRDPRWGRGHETYGEDPYLTSRLAVPFIKGMQGDGEYMKVAACAKHFAVHSGPEEKRHYFDAVVSKKDLEETYLPAFEACVTEAGVEAVMGAYNRTNGEPCCANRPLMQEILRGRWGFEGHYVSDCWAVRDFHESHHVTERPEESVKLALETGCDLNCGCTYERVVNAYEEGMLDKKYIRESCIRLFTTRFLLGMFDETEYDSIPYSKVECREHQALAARASGEGIVLLKNDGVLPLDKTKLRTIGVVGPNANSRVALIGNYHGTSSRYITVLEGIQDFVGDGVDVLYAEGCHLYESNIHPLSKPDVPDGFAEVQTVMEHSDVVVLVVGLDETLEGEQGDTGNSDASGDKKDLSFPKSQERLIDLVLKSGKPVIFINMTGSAMDLRLPEEKASAILQAWYPGARGGREVAKILFGEISPSGKLPVTFYRSVEDLPDFEDYSMKNRTYRFFTGEALYPFGYGLTYGDCALQKLEVEKKVDENGAF